MINHIAVVEGNNDLIKYNHQIWLNKYSFLLLKYDISLFEITIEFKNIDLKAALTVSYFLKNECEEKKCSFFLNDIAIPWKNVLNDTIHVNNNLNAVKVIFKEEDDFIYASTLFFWVDHSMYENLYLKSLEDKRIDALKKKLQ